MSPRGRITAVFRMVRKHVVKVKQRMEKGFAPLMKPLPMIVLAAVIGLFLFSLSSGFVFDTLEGILALFGATGAQVAQTRISATGLSYAVSCNAFHGQGGADMTNISVWQGDERTRTIEIPPDCPEERTFGVQDASIGGVTGFVTGTNTVTVYCPGSGQGESCYVNGYNMPQPSPPGQDCGIDPVCWVEFWIPGYGDPNLMVYHEKFPEDMAAVFTTTAYDTILMSAAFVGAVSFIVDVPGLARAGMAAGTRRVGTAAIGSRLGRALSGEAGVVAKFISHTVMPETYVRGTMDGFIRQSASEIVDVSESAIRRELDQVANPAADYGKDDFYEFIVRSRQPGVTVREARSSAQRIYSTWRSLGAARTGVLASKQEVDEALEGVARESVEETAVRAVREQWTSTYDMAEEMFSKMRPETRNLLRQRISQAYPVSRLRAVGDKEVAGRSLASVAGTICRSGCDEFDGGALARFSEAYLRGAGLRRETVDSFTSGNRRYITWAAVGSVAVAWYMDSKLGKFNVCSGNAICVDQPYQETDIRIELAPEAGAVWKGIRSPAHLEGRGDHHIRAWLASPCKADIKVDDDTTYCSSAEFYGPDGAWFEVTEPSISLPEYDSEYETGLSGGAGFDTVGRGGAETHVLRYDVGACAAYARESLEDQYVQEAGITEADTEVGGGGSSGACTGPWENPEASGGGNRADFTCASTDSDGNYCNDITSEALCTTVPGCSYGCDDPANRGGCDGTVRCFNPDGATVPEPTCGSIQDLGRDATIEYITAQNPEEMCDAVSVCNVDTSTAYDVGYFSSGTCTADSGGTKACTDIARMEFSASDNGFCTAIGFDPEDAMDCADINSITGSAQHNVNPRAACVNHEGCMWNSDFGGGDSSGGGDAACQAVRGICRDIESETICYYQASGGGPGSCEASADQPNDGFCDVLNNRGVGEGTCVDAGCNWEGGVGGGGGVSDDLGDPIDMDGDIAAQCAEQQLTDGTGAQCLDRAAVRTCSRLPQGVAMTYAGRIIEELENPPIHCEAHATPLAGGPLHGESASPSCSGPGPGPAISFSQGCSAVDELFPEADVDSWSQDRCETMLDRAVRSGDIWVSHMQAGDYPRDTDHPFFRTASIAGAGRFGQAFEDRLEYRVQPNGRIQFVIPASQWEDGDATEKQEAIENKMQEMTDIVKEEAWQRCSGTGDGPNSGAWAGATGFRDCGDLSESEFKSRVEVEWPASSPVNVAGDETYMVCEQGNAGTSWLGGGSTEEVDSIILEPGAYDPNSDDFVFNAAKGPFRNKYSEVSPNFCWENWKEAEDTKQLLVAAADIVIGVGLVASSIVTGPIGPAAAAGLGAASGFGSVFLEGHWNNKDKWPD